VQALEEIAGSKAILENLGSPFILFLTPMGSLVREKKLVKQYYKSGGGAVENINSPRQLNFTHLNSCPKVNFQNIRVSDYRVLQKYYYISRAPLTILKDLCTLTLSFFALLSRRKLREIINFYCKLGIFAEKYVKISHHI
jgi:hypothetical protein